MSSTLVNVGFTKSAAFSCLTSISFPIPNTDCNTSFPYIETVLLKNSELINTLSAIPLFPIDTGYLTAITVLSYDSPMNFL